MYSADDPPPGHRRLPRATRIEVTECGHCEWPHIMLYDENDQPMCDATVSDEHIKAIQAMRNRIRGRGRPN